MGGLVARYGLADMEKSVPGSSQTRLLILQDSPQRGANTPLGLQALVRQANINFGSFTLYDVNKALFQLNNLLDRPASQQLLLYRATDASSGCALNTFLDNTYRPKITFPSGQNPPYQIIATSNGSQCGNALFAPYTELARGDGNIFLSPFPWIIRTRYYAQVIVNAIPANGQANRLSTLQFYSIIRLFGFINIRNNFVREDYNCPAGLLAVDGVAGGTQYIGRRLPAALPTTAGIGFSFNPFFSANGSYSLQREFCFVPTASALDLADFNQATLQGKNINSINSISSSRTNGFIAQEPFTDLSRGGTYYNAFHTSFAARNSEWIFSKMENKQVPASYCSNECNPAPDLQISGPVQLCGSGSYSLSNFNNPITWSSSDPNVATINSISGVANTVATGNVIFSALNSAGCVVVTKTVQVYSGQPIPTGKWYYYTGSSSTTPLSSVQYVAPGQVTIVLDPLNDFSFRSSNSSAPVTRVNGRTVSFTLGRNMVVQITATPTNSTCVRSGTYAFSSQGYSYAATPNPASSELTVTKNSQYDSARSMDLTDGEVVSQDASTQPFEAILYDMMGNQVSTRTSANNKAVFRVQGLPTGPYVLRITQGKNTQTEHIQISH